MDCIIYGKRAIFVWGLILLGYVTCEKPEMKVRDFEIYNGYYCGICKSIGHRYGQIPRMTLSYDAAFLAVLLAGLEDEKDKVKREHCIIHHIKKKTIVSNGAVDYAGDVMLILAWHKAMDDMRDEGKFSAKASLLLMKKIYNKIKGRYPGLCQKIQEQLKELAVIEKEKCSNLDMAAESFAIIMEEIFNGYVEKNEREQILLKRLGYHMGKWIYLMDAYDDLEKDIENGSYNPLVYRYSKGEEEKAKDFAERIKEQCERNLLIYCSEMEKTIDLLDIKKNKGIIENIVYMGLLRRTEKALGKEEAENGESV
ncbi:MAG TPA: DUF5685 family protein [Bacillota bacterium]|nr:DUF5685 family protein [Bacillota bacterium]HUM56152.1 DUF5685 family protein [Bacillota bacterium]